MQSSILLVFVLFNLLDLAVKVKGCCYTSTPSYYADQSSYLVSLSVLMRSNLSAPIVISFPPTATIRPAQTCTISSSDAICVDARELFTLWVSLSDGGWPTVRSIVVGGETCTLGCTAQGLPQGVLIGSVAAAGGVLAIIVFVVLRGRANGGWKQRFGKKGRDKQDQDTVSTPTRESGVVSRSNLQHRRSPRSDSFPDADIAATGRKVTLPPTMREIRVRESSSGGLVKIEKLDDGVEKGTLMDKLVQNARTSEKEMPAPVSVRRTRDHGAGGRRGRGDEDERPLSIIRDENRPLSQLFTDGERHREEERPLSIIRDKNRGKRNHG
ncbi:hypothetical protein BJ742DRAFT_779932 [Cladochytrium replicatum]|nr:hypothetical protein BJ742DRAFT_779932 [Cladochytrium replicatum]